MDKQYRIKCVNSACPEYAEALYIEVQTLEERFVFILPMQCTTCWHTAQVRVVDKNAGDDPPPGPSADAVTEPEAPAAEEPVSPTSSESPPASDEQHTYGGTSEPSPPPDEPDNYGHTSRAAE